MKDSLSSVDLSFLVRELQELRGSRLDKVYQGEGARKRDLTFQLRVTGGKRLLRVLPGLLYVAERKASYGRLPGHFAVFLRKHLGNARLLEARQRGFERILEVLVENKHGEFTLLFELLPPGNVLLLNDAGKIINLLEPQRHGQRLLRGGAVYEPPPAQPDPVAASDDELVALLRERTKDAVVKALATAFSLGGAYAEEVCARAGVDKARADLSEEELRSLVEAFRGLLASSLAPNRCGGEVFPVAMATRLSEQGFPSFSAAIESLVPEDPLAPEEKRATPKKDIVAQQEVMLAGFEKAAAENQRKGELLYERYQEVAAALVAAKKGAAHALIEKTDRKKGEVVLEL